MAKKVTLQEIKKRLEKVHNGNVSIVDSTYINVTSKAEFIDKKYGKWTALVDNVIRGQGHPDKKKSILADSVRIPLATIIDRIKQKHNDIVTLDVSTYVNTATEARFVDKEFGEWWALPKNIMKGRGHKSRISTKISKSKTRSIDYVKEKIKETHGNTIILIEESYIDMSTKCKFLDTVHGIWESRPARIITGVGHPNRELEKMKRTNLKKYGVMHNMHSPELALKVAKSSSHFYNKHHWKTNEELVCVASYESKVVDYLNANQIDFEWQPEVFSMPNGKTYRPDLYLPDQDIWIEIKGYMRPDAQNKWDWFKSEHPTAELWNKEKLKEIGIL